MKPKICLTIGNTDLKGAHEAIDYAKSKGAEFVELRFDMISETACCEKSGDAGLSGKINGIISYAKKDGIKLIGTYRDNSYSSNRCVSFLDRQRLPEQAVPGKKIKEYSGQARIDFLKSIIDLGIDICDIELDIFKKHDIKDFVDFAHSKKSEVILSVHDFYSPIHLLDAIKYYIDSCYFGADYFKLADTVVSESDAAAVLEKNLKIRSIKMTGEASFPNFIIFGMGEKGKATRAVSVIHGSYLAYCSSQYGTTAPGQMGIDDFNEMLNCAGAY